MVTGNMAERQDERLAGITVEMAGPQDGADVLSFINKIQPQIPWDDIHLRWQFFEAPAGHARIYTIRAEQRIVSLYCACPKVFSLHGETRKAFMVQDVMTDPAYRGRGLLHRLAQRCVDDIKRNDEVGYTFPNKLSEGSFRRRAWAELMRVPLRTCNAISVPNPPEHLISPMGKAFPADTIEIWRGSGIEIGVQRSAGYLNWRYRRPHQTYFRFSIGDGAGYLVLKLYDADAGRLLHICDLLVTQQARRVVRGALHFCHGFARANGAERITAWLPEGHPYSGDFDALGLKCDKAHDRFIFAIQPHDAALLMTPSNWHLTQCDSDVY